MPDSIFIRFVTGLPTMKSENSYAALRRVTPAQRYAGQLSVSRGWFIKNQNLSEFTTINKKFVYMGRLNISSGSVYEKPIGCSRAVRIGNINK